MKMTVSGCKAVLEDGTIRWRFSSGWYTKTTTMPPKWKVSDAEAKELEAAYQAAMSGKAPEWDYLDYLDQVERAEGGRVLPEGNLEPADAYHETGAGGLG